MVTGRKRVGRLPYPVERAPHVAAGAVFGHQLTETGQQVGERGARGIHPDAEQPEVRTAHQSAGHHPERGGADVTGDLEVQRLQTLGGLNRHTHPIESNFGAHRAQHHLGVVARAH